MPGERAQGGGIPPKYFHNNVQLVEYGIDRNAGPA